MRQYLDDLHVTAKEHGLHVGLAKQGKAWVLSVSRPNTALPLNEMPIRDLHGSLDAAADVLRAWIESKGAPA